MMSNYRDYNFDASLARIDSILLNSPSLEELDDIPPREKLTYSNGFYVKCTALFADIRESSSLTEDHKRPKLAKLYRAFISEVVAIINSNKNCKEIDIIGDCVSGIFSTRTKSEIEGVVATAAWISALIDVLNCKFSKSGIAPIRVGIGISKGRALMVQAGLQGSGINEVIWMGDVVNEACKLSGLDILYGQNGTIRINDSVYASLSEVISGDWFSHDIINNCYQGNLGIMQVNDWIQNNCKK